MKKLYLMLAVLLTLTTSVSANVRPNRNVTLDDILRQRKDGWVYDYADLLTDREEDQLNRRISGLERQGQGQMAIVIVDHMEDRSGSQYDAFDFGYKIFSNWGIGNKREDDGILLLVSLNPRKLFINTGYGKEVEDVDALCSRICRSTIAPLMKRKQFYDAFDAGIDEIYKTRPERMQYNTTYRTNRAASYAQEQAEKLQRQREELQERIAQRAKDSVYNLPANVAARARQKALDDAESAKSWQSFKDTMWNVFETLFLIALGFFGYTFYKQRREAKRVENAAKEAATAKLREFGAKQLGTLETYINQTKQYDFPVSPGLTNELAPLQDAARDLYGDKMLVEAAADENFVNDFCERVETLKARFQDVNKRIQDEQTAQVRVQRVNGRFKQVSDLVAGIDVPKAEADLARYIAAAEEVGGKNAVVIEKSFTIANEYKRATKAVKDAEAAIAAVDVEKAELHLTTAVKAATRIEDELSYASEQKEVLLSAKKLIPAAIKRGKVAVDASFKEGLNTRPHHDIIDENEKLFTANTPSNWKNVLVAIEQAGIAAAGLLTTKKRKEQDRIDEAARKVREAAEAVEREKRRKQQAILDEENRIKRKREQEEEDERRRQRRKREEEEEDERRRNSSSSSYGWGSSSSSSSDDSSSSWGGGSSGGGGGGSDW